MLNGAINRDQDQKIMIGRLSLPFASLLSLFYIRILRLNQVTVFSQFILTETFHPNALSFENIARLDNRTHLYSITYNKLERAWLD